MESQYKILNYQPDFFEKVSTLLYNDCNLDTAKEKFKKHVLNNHYINNSEHILLSFEDRFITGCIVVAEVQNKILILRNVGKNKDIRLHLINDIERYSFSKGISFLRIILSAGKNEEINFYKKNGFVETFKYISSIQRTSALINNDISPTSDLQIIQLDDLNHEIKVIQSLYNELYSFNYKEAVNTIEMKNMLKIWRDDYFFLILKNNSPIGLAVCDLNQKNNTGEIIELGIRPQYRDKGIGKYLAQYCFRFLKKKGALDIEIETTDEDRRVKIFWQKNGFKKFSVNESNYEKRVA